MSAFRHLLVLMVALGWAVPSAAQIYSWRDADGKLVLSDRPRAGSDPKTYKSAPFDASINEHARRQGVAPDLVRAVIEVESAFNPVAVSNRGAMGLMQLMPSTAQALGVSNPFDPDQNIRGGVTYLKQLLTRYDHKVDLALAAYNAGIGNVEKYGAVPPFKETRNYVAKITRAVPPEPGNAIYKCFELVDGRPRARYSNTPPERGSYEIVR